MMSARTNREVTTMRRRAFLGGTAGALALGTAQAQVPTWQPTRPIQCIVGFAPGGGTDLIARAIVEATQPLIPQPLVVMNRPGAGGTIGAQQVAMAPPDGHTLLMGGGSESTSIPVFRQLAYDSRGGFRAVLRVMRQRLFILAKADGRFRTLPDAMAAAKEKPQAVSHGSSGNGSIYHAVFVVLEKQAGVELLHVPFNGGAPGLQALAAGQIDLMVAAPEEFRGLVDGGLLRPLACCSAERAESFPRVPTLRELGWEVVLENMKGWQVPAGTPDAAVQYLHDRFRQGMAGAPWRAFLERAGDTDAYLDGPGFQRAMDQMMEAIAGAVRRG
jgi:tripartite-type tricarboxylate transporter receptor subunit TctC